MLWILISGALRKWAFPSYERAIFLAGDGLLFLVYVSYIAQRRTRGKPVEGRSLYVWLAMFAAFAGLSPLLHFSNPITALVGLRYYLIFLPLVYLVPQLYDNMGQLRRDLYVYCMTAIPLGLLAAYQFTQPATSVWNRYVARDMDMLVAMVGEHPRVTATFSYIAGFTDYLVVVGLVTVALYFWMEKRSQKATMLVVLVLIIECMFMTGSRAPVLAIAVALPSISFLFFASPRLAFRNALFLVLLAVLVVAGTEKFGHSALDAFTKRAEESNQDAPERVIGYIMGPIMTLGDVDALGVGIGMTFQGAQLVEDISSHSFDEVAQDRVVMDLGIFGLMFEMVITVLILWGFLKVALTTKYLLVRALAIILLTYHALFLIHIPVYDSTAMAYYCFTAGLYPLLAKLGHTGATGQFSRQMLIEKRCNKSLL
jgi:hypothetical protein